MKMAEKKKGKKRKEELGDEETSEETPSKEEYAVAKWLRKNVPTKKTKFLNHNVEYFTAVKAVDALMQSRWAEAKGGEEPMFATRMDVVHFLDNMLRHKLFHRAKKVPVSEQELKAKLKKKDKDRKKDEKTDEAESSHAEGDKHSDDKEKRKRKIRLEMHMEQLFVDGLDAYVWIYDPIPVYYWFFGTLVVLGGIAICLFPLWPPSVRKGVYYFSVTGAGFLIFIIALALVRLVMFCLLWILTFGKLHLWLFPNLTEDVGFLASFWPLYQYEYKGDDGDKKSRKKKEKDSDNEDDKQTDEKEDDSNVEDEPDKNEDAADAEVEKEGSVSNKEQENSESESESSQKSQTGKDFEMVEREEVES